MRIMGVDQALLGVEDIDSARRFYRDFGLVEAEAAANGALFRTTDNSEIVVKPAQDLGLPKAVAGGSNIREVVWAVETGEELQKIGAELARDRAVQKDRDDTLHSVDDDGNPIAFRRMRRETSKNAHTSRATNERVDFSAPVTPVAIAHIGLWSPDIPRAMKFYSDRLKFRVSDSFKSDNGVFLRPAGSQEHHTLLLIRGREKSKGLNHIAFRVADFNQVMLGGTRASKKGWETMAGPGRHIIGSNYSWYLKSPCGGAMEYSADMDRADDSWQAREWDAGPDTFYAWAVTHGAPVRPVS